jgi:hypothetical protein
LSLIIIGSQNLLESANAIIIFLKYEELFILNKLNNIGLIKDHNDLKQKMFNLYEEYFTALKPEITDIIKTLNNKESIAAAERIVKIVESLNKITQMNIKPAPEFAHFFK